MREDKDTFASLPTLSTILHGEKKSFFFSPFLFVDNHRTGDCKCELIAFRVRSCQFWTKIKFFHLKPTFHTQRRAFFVACGARRMQSRTVLVTGAKGFIGSHLCIHLRKRGFEVWELDEKVRDCGFEAVQGDLCDAECLAKAFEGNPFAVFHLAARPGVRWCEENQHECWRTNVIGTGLLLEEAAKHACVQHFIFASSSLVYADAPVPWTESIDTQNLNQCSIYAKSKKMGEALVRPVKIVLVF
jgi:hypothetical protein